MGAQAERRRTFGEIRRRAESGAGRLAGSGAGIHSPPEPGNCSHHISNNACAHQWGAEVLPARTSDQLQDSTAAVSVGVNKWRAHHTR